MLDFRDCARNDEVEHPTLCCEHRDVTVRKDNGVPFEGLTLQTPADRHRGHDIKRKLKVLRHTDGTLSVQHGPRMLSAQGQKLTEDLSVAA